MLPELIEKTVMICVLVARMGFVFEVVRSVLTSVPEESVVRSAIVAGVAATMASVIIPQS